MRIATYNIHRCIGSDGIEAPARIAAVLRQINPDVTALQEVVFDAAVPVNVLEVLAGSIGAEAIPGPTRRERKGAFGNVVLTRIAPDRVERLDISVPGREPRGAVVITLRMNGMTVNIAAVHLGLYPGERRYQVGRILKLLDRRSAAVTILLGDFNEWFFWGRPLRWVDRRFGPMPAPATFPSRRPMLALDRIWVHPADKLISLQRHWSGTAAIASDHLPLVAEVAI